MNNNNCLEAKIEEVYNYISLINKEAYKDVFLLSNQVLSKNPFANNFLKRFLDKEKLKQHPAHIVFFKFIKYHIKTFKYFILYMFNFIVYFLSSIRFSFSSNTELILIDTFFLMDNIKKLNSYTDPYFPGLEDLFKKMNKHYAYLPAFYGPQKPVDLYGVLKILRKKRVPVLSEFQLLSIHDLLYLLYFAIIYPYRVLKFTKRLSANDWRAKLLKYELMDTIDQVTFCSFSRYLQGKKIAALPYKNIKVISWYENQVIDKNLYKGLRANMNKVKIYGAQLFIYSKDMLNIVSDENEKTFGVTPDKIIANGPWFIPKKSRFDYVVGPSLRYSSLFSTCVKKEDQKNILALLPFDIENAENILRVLHDVKIFSQPIYVKVHPCRSIGMFKQPLSPNLFIVNEDIYKLFETTKIIIGAASSGTLVEAASSGIPAILIKNTSKIECSPLPKCGKGVIWEEVDNPEALKCQIDNFEYALSNNPKEIHSIANTYKRMFFCEPAEESTVKAFDL